MKTLIFFLITLSSFAEAPTGRVKALVLDPNFDSGTLSGSGVTIDQIPPSQSDLPSPRVRNDLFSRAGLKQELKGWDELEKDLLYIRAKSLEFQRLSEKYPKIAPKRLKKLKELISKGPSK